MLRWILLANHMEPVQGLLCRFLRRRLVQSELKARSRNCELGRIIEWIPRCWSHLNKFLETYNSADITIGKANTFSLEYKQVWHCIVSWACFVCYNVISMQWLTTGPCWFLLVPSDSTCSQVWFTDLWNYTLGPYLLHAAKEGLQLYGKRSAWEDPAQWIVSTYPWNHGSAFDTLMRLVATAIFSKQEQTQHFQNNRFSPNYTD